MTKNPTCCTVNGTAREAAEIMRNEDVGPVPIVNSEADRRVVGIVTDRDITIKVTASGRDAGTTRIAEVMSSNPVTCRETDDVQAAVEAMKRNQIRRVPIVDSEGRLAGIVAQADLARLLDEEHVGDLVEEVSQPSSGMVGRAVGRASSAARNWSTEQQGGPGGVLLAVGIGAALGAGLMAIFNRERDDRLSTDRRDLQSYR
jgi:CBS domain-containing protein